ncbi:patatin [Prosthecochloris sp. GSB1]|nr:patatin [Prosthecochloris sp. GSB1]
MRPARKSVGLALSGGGANGMAQIGILKAFEEEGVPVDAIVGTSIGAVVGGLYSAGYNAADLEQIALGLEWKELLSLDNDVPRTNTFLEQQKIRDRATLAIRFEDFKLVIPKSLSSAQKLTRAIDLLTINAPYHPAGPFSTLPVAFKAVTTDLVSGKRITLSEGELSEAMRASSTIPIIFEPIAVDSFKLADGGLVANLAVDELEKASLDYKIGIDTRGSMYTLAKDIDVPWQAADQAMTILIELQYPEQLKKADLVIAPDVGNNPAIDFSRLPELIDAGYRSGKALAAKIRKDISIKPVRRSDIGSFRKSLRVSGTGEAKLRDVNAAGEIVRNARYAEEALRELLETDRFARVYATLDYRSKEAVFFCQTPPVFSKVRLSSPSAAIRREKLDACFAPLGERTYLNSEGTRALENLLKLFREEGYPLVDIERVKVVDGTLIVEMNEGTVSNLTISQDKNMTGRTPVMRELAFDTTKALRLQDVEKSVDNLFGTGAFNRVSIGVTQDSKAEEGKKPLRIKLSEKPSNVLRLGLRYDETYNAQALLDFRNENLNGTANSVGGWTKIGEKNNRATLEFNMPRIGSTNLTFTTKFFYDQRVLDIREPSFSKEFFFSDPEATRTFGIQRYGLNTSFGARIGKNSQLLLDLGLENAQTFEDGDGIFETEDVDISSVAAQFTLDTRNSSFLPTEGRYSSVRYVIVPELLNDKTFWKFHLSHEENIPFRANASGQLSLSLGLGGEGLPFSEMFFIGGAGSPYSQRFIGLKENDRIGPNMAMAGASVRYSPPFDIIFPSSFLLYYNAGNVWNRREEMSFDDLVHGIGAGITWKTPLGPARFTAGKAFTFNEQLADENETSLRFAETVFYFSLGHEF